MVLNYINKIDYKRALTILITLYLIKNIIDYYIFEYRFWADITGTYSYFQYYYNFFLKYKSLPIWIDYLDGGFPSILPLQIEGGVFLYFFVIFGSIFQSAFFSFHLYCLTIYFVFCYGFYQNIKISNNIKSSNKIKIFLIITSIFLFSTDFFYLNNMHLSAAIFLIIFYKIRKFFINLKFIELLKIYLFSISMFFMFPHYANIINFFYIPLMIFIFSFFLNYKKINNIKFKSKYYLYIFSSLFLSFILVKILIYEKSLYYFIATDRLENGKVLFEDFLNRRAGDIKNFIGYWLYQEHTLNIYPVCLTPVGIYIFIITILNKKLYSDKDNITYIFSLVIIFLISFSNNFYFFSNFFMKTLFQFPMVDYVRNLLNTIYLFKPIILLFISNGIDLILNWKKLNYKNILSPLIILIFIYTEFLFSIRFNSVDPNMFIYSIIVFITFFALYILSLKFNSNFLLLAIILPFIAYHIFSLNSQAYKERKINLYKTNIDQVYLDNQLYESDICFKFKDINDKYSFIIPTKRSGAHIFLNTYQKPCILHGNLRIRGSKKQHNHETVEEFRKKLSKNKNPFLFPQNIPEKNFIFNKKYLFEKEYFYVSNIYANEFDVKKIDNTKFLIKNEINKSNYVLNISYSKNWKAYDLKGAFLKVKNSNGYLQVDKCKTSNYF